MVGVGKIAEFLKQCLRVLKVSSKPKKREFLLTAKICALGIIILGIIGFIVYAIFELLG